MYIAGTLRKWTNYFNGWQERWFVLDNGILSYYKSQDDVTNGCKGSVKMSVCDIVVHATDQTRLDLIIPGEQHFYVKAANPQERQEWLVALGSAKASIGKLSEESDDVTQDLLKSKRSELRLYCDLLMQQIHSVKTAVEEQGMPNVQKLNEATSLISPTCDTFIETLDECMRLARTNLTFEGQHPVIVDATVPASPLKLSNKKGKLTHRQNSSERSFHSHSRSPSVSSTESMTPSRQNSQSQTISEMLASDLNLMEHSGTRNNDLSHSSSLKVEINSSQSSKPKVQSYKSDLKSIQESVHLNETGSQLQLQYEGNLNNSNITSHVSQTMTDSFKTSQGHKPQTGSPNGDVVQSDEEVFLDPMEERVPTFFSELNPSFLDLPICDDGGIPVQPFLDSCRCLLPIFDKLNSTAFAPVKLDFKGNIQKVHTKYTSNTGEFPTLQSMVSHEVSLKQSHLPHSASMALLWMKRSLQFISGFMEEIVKGQDDLSVAATNSYSQSLKPYHGWVVRGVFAVAVKALPYKETFLSLLHSPATANNTDIDNNLFITCLYQDIHAYMTALKIVVKILDDFFDEKGLNSSEQI